jgi:hypothetical protein
VPAQQPKAEKNYVRCHLSVALGVRKRYPWDVRARARYGFGDWRGLVYAFRPPVAECYGMVEVLVERWGVPGVCALLGVSKLTLNHWRERDRKPYASAQRLIWLLWCWTFHPDWMAQVGDWLTWGKLRAKGAPSIRQMSHSTQPESCPR